MQFGTSGTGPRMSMIRIGKHSPDVQNDCYPTNPRLDISLQSPMIGAHKRLPIPLRLVLAEMIA